MRKTRRSKWRVMMTVALLVLAALPVGYWLMGRRGRRAVETWIGQELIRLANGNLGPQIRFKTLEYRFPRTVVLTEVRLTAEDAAAPGGSVDIVAMRKLTLELAEIPRKGEPIRIEQLILDHPELRLIAGGKAKAGLLGFSHFFRAGAGEGGTTSPGAAATGTATRNDDLRLSKFFDIHKIELIDGMVIFDPRVSGQPAMELDELNTRLDVKAPVAGGAGGGAGWYGLELTVDRKPVFSGQVSGRVNMDTAVLDVTKLHVASGLGREEDHYLPPALQAFLQQHEVKGKLQIDGTAHLPLRQWRESRMDARLQLSDGQIALGAHRWPVQMLEAGYVMDQGIARLSSLRANLLGGNVEGTGSLDFSQANRAAFTLQLQHLRLEQTLREKGGKGAYRGDLSGQIHWQSPLGAAGKESRGDGVLTLADGQVDVMPGVGEVLNAFRGVMKVAGIAGDAEQDTGSAVFTFQGDRMNFSKLELVTSWSVLRGVGDIYWDRRLDLRVNGGPLEKAESLLGGVGDLIGKATDQLTAYRVTGTMTHPSVSVEVAPGLRLP